MNGPGKLVRAERASGRRRAMPTSEIEHETSSWRRAGRLLGALPPCEGRAPRIPQSTRPRRNPVALWIALATLAVAGGAGAQPVSDVLILDTTVSGGVNSVESVEAQALGLTVDVVDAATWGAMTTAQFAQYRAIVLGDRTCSSVSVAQPAIDNRGTWGPAVDGNVFIIGSDPVFHQVQGGRTVTRNGIGFAVDEPETTGAYITTSCYGAVAGVTQLLEPFGAFTPAPAAGCANDVHIVAMHPALGELTDEELSDWNCSIHNGFDAWPNSFLVLAIGQDVPSEYMASDGTTGSPYVLARGAGLVVISDISLAPMDATLPVGSLHTLTATVAEDGEAVVGTTVTFTVIDGPNDGVTGEATTDSDGVASFSYGSDLAGTDTAHAQFLDSQERTQTSNTVTVTWLTEEVDETPPECSGEPADGGFEGSARDTGSGLSSVALQEGAWNLTLSVDPFEPGTTDPVGFSAQRADSQLDASGTVVATDREGNQCSVDVNLPGDGVVPVAAFADETTDVEVYVGEAGRAAFVAALTDGMPILNVSNRMAVSELGRFDPDTCPDAGSPIPREFKAWDVHLGMGVAYIAAGFCGVLVVDVSGAFQPGFVPKLIGQIDTPGYAFDVVVQTRGEPPVTRAYVADAYGGLSVYRVLPTMPVSGQLIGTLGAGSIPLGPPSFGIAVDVEVEDDGEVCTAYVAWSEGFGVVDCTPPAAPSLLAFVNTNASGTPWTESTSFPQDVELDRERWIAYVSHLDGGLLPFDVSDRSSPVFLGDEVVPTDSQFNEAFVNGDRVYVTEGNGLAFFEDEPENGLFEVAGSPLDMGGPAGSQAIDVEVKLGVAYVSLANNVAETGGLAIVVVEPPPPPPCGLLGIEPFVLLAGLRGLRRLRARARA